MLEEFISFLRNTCRKENVLVKKDRKLTVVSVKDTLSTINMNIAVVFQESSSEVAIQIRRPISRVLGVSDYEATNYANATYKDIKLYFDDNILHCVSYTAPDGISDLKRMLSVLMIVMASVSEKIK